MQDISATKVFVSYKKFSNTFMVGTSCICQLLSCYVFAQESITPSLIGSVAMSLYDIMINHAFVMIYIGGL